MISRAKLRLKKMPKLRNSITNNTATLHGFVGEELLAEYWGADVIGDYHYDLMKNGFKIETKTKRTTVEPLPYYEVSIAEFNTRQKCNYYAFTRVTKNLDTGWFVGIMPKVLYLLKARDLKRGQRDGDNGFIVKADCWNMEICDLLDSDRDDFMGK